MDEKKEVVVEPADKLRVAVTGASGFIGSHCIKRLLEEGYLVVGTVRSDPNADKYRWLFNLTVNKALSANLTLKQANLMTDGSYDDIFIGCDYVLHVASPYIFEYVDPIKDLLEPAKFGTLNVLKSCLAAFTDVNNENYRRLRRIVITSSFAAVSDSPINGKVYTEDDWNEISSLTRNPYSYSKAEAERAAWDWWKDTNDMIKLSFDIVTANPSMVVGPELNPECKSLNTSNQVLVDIASGKFPVKLNVEFAIVDVVDVANAHILLMSNSECKGRHLITCQTLSFQAISDRIENCAKDHSFETSLPCFPCNCKCCYCFIWCLAGTEKDGVRDFLRSNVNTSLVIDNSKLKEYGFEYRDMDDTFNDALANFLQLGFLKEIENAPKDSTRLLPDSN